MNEYREPCPGCGGSECRACDQIRRTFEACVALVGVIAWRDTRAYRPALRALWDAADLAQATLGGWPWAERFEHWNGRRVAGVPDAVTEAVRLGRVTLHPSVLERRERFADEYVLHAVAVARKLWRLMEQRRAAKPAPSAIEVRPYRLRAWVSDEDMKRAEQQPSLLDGYVKMLRAGIEAERRRDERARF